MPARLLLIRHGESVLGAQHRYAGHSDPPLSERGRRQVTRLRSRVLRHRPDLVVSSDLRRCRETARLLNLRTKALSTPLLRELRFGAWEGLTHEETLRRFPKRYPRWLNDPVQALPPGGESLRALALRVRTFVHELIREHPGRTVALVTHGGPIRVLLAGNLADFWRFDVPPAALFVLNPARIPEAA